MAKFILRDADVVLAGVNISDHVDEVEVTAACEDKDGTAMGATNRDHTPGLRDDSFKLKLFQDFEAGEIEPTVWPLLGVEAGFLVEVKPKSGAVAANNPKYSATCVLLEHQPLAGQVGEFAMTELELPCKTSIVRAVA
jgi:hypothetical protein